MKTPLIILALAAFSLAQTPYSLHLPDALPAAGDALVAESNIHYDDDETTVLLKWAAPAAGTPPAEAPTVTVFSERPGLRSSDFTGRSLWTLAHVPTPNGLACYSNGLRQTPGVEYVTALNGAIISHVWLTTDIILCDYYYRETP